ncbi:MAG: hypothetical protein M0D53_12120 [Flavobacterium sp. JAD_PAG50586_2]|nr:MAG: hypothetical protein M0D53_12120 [Flavobacterium sp. JAD_PAG50586_2]
MMPISKNTSFMFILLILAITCAKEKDEPANESDQETIDEVKTASKAATDWKKFNHTSEKLLAITATNLKSLSALHAKTLNVDEKDSLFLIYVQSNNEYLELKSRLAHENAAFEKDIIKYNPQSEIKYRAFKNKFFSDVLDLNANIEDTLDEIGAD